jgi:hypothetical protein
MSPLLSRLSPSERIPLSGPAIKRPNNPHARHATELAGTVFPDRTSDANPSVCTVDRLYLGLNRVFAAQK